MNPSIHIGKKIREQLSIQKRSVAWLASELHIDPSNLRKILNRTYISTDMLYRISVLLNKDFFVCFSRLLAEDQHIG